MLLLLHKQRDRSWNADTVAAELRIQPLSAATRLEALAKAGFLVSTAPTFTFDAACGSGPVIVELERAYQTHRVRIIELIFSRPGDNIRVFADAFLIGGKGPRRDG